MKRFDQGKKVYNQLFGELPKNETDFECFKIVKLKKDMLNILF